MIIFHSSPDVSNRDFLLLIFTCFIFETFFLFAVEFMQTCDDLKGLKSPREMKSCRQCMRDAEVDRRGREPISDDLIPVYNIAMSSLFCYK